MCKNTVILPNEILEIVMSNLNDDEIVVCSGIDSRWYTTARRCLASRTGFELCRWPDVPTAHNTRLCLAGNRIVVNVGRYKSKRLKRLKICFDESTHLNEETLEQIFMAYKNLSSLELLNLSSIDWAQAEVILDRCRPGLKLRISLQKLSPRTAKAINTLNENRELLSEIVVEIQESNTLLGWCPIPSYQNEIYVKDNVQSVELDGKGLVKMKFNDIFNSLTSLKITNCDSLLDDDLIRLSRLQLIKFYISNCNFKEIQWARAFNSGFNPIKFGSFVNCSNFTDAVLNALSNKPLESLTVDMRNGASENRGISHLHRIKQLKRLHVLVNQIVTNQLLTGVTHHWTNLVSLTVEESIIGYNFKLSTASLLSQNLNLKPNVEFEHKLNRTKIENNAIRNFGLF